MNTKPYNPDVLSCLANLSNDEVFTPPEVVNKMLDLLPAELWSNPDARFLDPVSKTGVFLREIAKRLLVGLADKIPDLQERINHIFTQQLYGIAITELTAYLSRRSLYCSKSADGKYSVSTLFDTPEGNLRYRPMQHTWENGKCKYCGASQAVYDRASDLETHAYEFIHTNPQTLYPNMTFDVIIGNPPYQLSFGIEGANSSNAKSIYNQFIENAIKLKSHYLVMIIPSRWMTKTAQAIPEVWVDKMLRANQFRIIHDFENSELCFPGVSIMGGVNYFLWDNNYKGKCDYYYHTKERIIHRFDYLDAMNAGIVVRDPQTYSILEKIIRVEKNYYSDERNFSSMVSPKHFFDDGNVLTSNWKGYKEVKTDPYNIKYYLNKTLGTAGWISREQMPKNIATLPLHKVYIPAARGDNYQVLGEPFYGEPNSICSQTYLVIGYDSQRHNFTKEECENIITYIRTRFFRFLVAIKKKTQNGPRGVYQFVPIQDFSKPWTDEELYKKYNLTDEEIAFIESMIKPME